MVIFVNIYNLFAGNQRTDSLVNKLEHNLPDTQKVDILNKLSRLLFYSNPDSAAYYARQAMKIADEQEFDNRKAYSLTTFGFFLDEEGKYDSSLMNYRKAIDIYSETGDQQGLSYAVLNKGLAYMHMGDYTKALKAFQEASEIAKNIDYPNIIGASAINMGIIQRKQGNNRKALNYYNEALEVFKSQEQMRNVANAYSNLGVARNEMEDNKKALENFNTALTTYKNLGDKRGMAVNYANIAGIYEEQEDYKKALKYYEEANDIFMDLGDKGRISKTFTSIASIHYQIAESVNIDSLKRRNYKLALSKATEAHKIANEIGAWEQIKLANKNLSSTYESLGNQTKALDYYKLYDEAKDSLFNIEKNRQLEELEIQYQTEKKEKRIQLLEKNKLLQKAKLNKSRTIQYISITAASVIFVLLLIIYSKYRRQKRLTNELAEKNDEIKEQREEYQKLNATKDRLLSVISHDLRSPVSHIINFSEYIHEGNLDKNKIKEFNFFNYQNATALLFLLENLLEWAKNQQDEIYIQPEKQPLYPLIVNNLEVFNNLAKNKNIEIKTDISGEGLQAFFDYNMISTVIRNLISNAIKFTPEDGKLEVTLKELEDKVKVAVADTGIGISDEAKQKIFDEYNHFTSAGTKQERGTGIGLSISKAFIEKNGGELFIDSKPNGGSTFWFTLPKVGNGNNEIRFSKMDDK